MEKRTYSLHAASTLTKRLLDTVLMVLNALVTGGMMLLLHHSKTRLQLYSESQLMVLCNNNHSIFKPLTFFLIQDKTLWEMDCGKSTRPILEMTPNKTRVMYGMGTLHIILSYCEVELIEPNQIVVKSNNHTNWNIRKANQSQSFTHMKTMRICLYCYTWLIPFNSKYTITDSIERCSFFFSFPFVN